MQPGLAHATEDITPLDPKGGALLAGRVLQGHATLAEITDHHRRPRTDEEQQIPEGEVQYIKQERSAAFCITAVLPRGTWWGRSGFWVHMVFNRPIWCCNGQDGPCRAIWEGLGPLWSALQHGKRSVLGRTPHSHLLLAASHKRGRQLCSHTAVTVCSTGPSACCAVRKLLHLHGRHHQPSLAGRGPYVPTH